MLYKIKYKKIFVFFIIITIIFTSINFTVQAVDEIIEPNTLIEETTPLITEPVTQEPTQPLTQEPTIPPTQEPTKPTTIEPTIPPTTQQETQESTTQVLTEETTTKKGFIESLFDQPDEPEISEETKTTEKREVSTTKYVLNGMILWGVIVVGCIIILGVLGVTFKRKNKK